MRVDRRLLASRERALSSHRVPRRNDIPSTAGTRTGQDCEPAIMVTFQKIRKHVTTNEGHVTWHDPGSPVGRGLVARYRW